MRNDGLKHYGKSKRDGAPVGSGRYPLGSGAAGADKLIKASIKEYNRHNSIAEAYSWMKEDLRVDEKDFAYAINVREYHYSKMGSKISEIAKKTGLDRFDVWDRMEIEALDKIGGKVSGFELASDTWQYKQFLKTGKIPRDKEYDEHVKSTELKHFGVSKRDGAPVGSGRYPLGSGGNSSVSANATKSDKKAEKVWRETYNAETYKLMKSKRFKDSLVRKTVISAIALAGTAGTLATLNPLPATAAVALGTAATVRDNKKYKKDTEEMEKFYYQNELYKNRKRVKK